MSIYLHTTQKINLSFGGIGIKCKTQLIESIIGDFKFITILLNCTHMKTSFKKIGSFI